MFMNIVLFLSFIASDRTASIVESELQVYTWRDASLRELIDLIKDVSEEARQMRSSQLSLKLIHRGGCVCVSQILQVNCRQIFVACFQTIVEMLSCTIWERLVD